jgi:hypothetical protein
LALAVADFNADANPDLAVAALGGGVSVLLGNGDGTFQPRTSYTTPPAPGSLVLGDFNGDGKVDLAVSAVSGASILMGNGDGTFQSKLTYMGGKELVGIAGGDFNADGRMDLAAANAQPALPFSVLLQSNIGLNKTDIAFAPQEVGTGSIPKNIRMTNFTTTTIPLGGVTLTGNDPQDFGQNNTCGSSIAPGASCTFSVVFTPQGTGSRNALMNITDGGLGGLQTVVVSGVGN